MGVRRVDPPCCQRISRYMRQAAEKFPCRGMGGALASMLAVAAVALAATTASAAPACYQKGAHIMLKVVVRHNNDMVVSRTIEEAYEHIILETHDIAPLFAERLRRACTGDVITEDVQPLDSTVPPVPHSWIPTRWREFKDDTFHVHATVHEVVPEEDYAIFPLIKQARYGDVLDLIEAGRGVNAVDEWGFTPLMRAIAVKQPVVVAALLNCRKARVDIHKQRPSGHTALFYAAVYDHPSILRLLLKMRADPRQQLTARGSKGSTPLHFACMFGLRKNAELLLEFGADPEARNEAGATPTDLIDHSLPPAEIEAFERLLHDAIQKKRQGQLGGPESRSSEL